MCLAVPAQIVEIDRAGQTAMAKLGEVQKEVSIELLDDVSVDDFVLIHVGFALNTISQSEAEHTLKLFEEAGLGPAELT